MMTEKPRIVYALVAPLLFPEGFSIAGGNSSRNALELERDGRGNPVIRGSSIAGVLREKVKNDPRFAKKDVDRYFGTPLNQDMERHESSLIFHDTPLKSGSEESMHNLMCRHTGSVSEENKGLFSIEKVVPGARGKLFFQLNSFPGMEKKDEELLHFLAECLNGVIFVGGNANRGTGRCLLENDRIFFGKFNLADPEDAAEYLDLLYMGNPVLPETRTVPRAAYGNRFRLRVAFRIPRGQDLLCSEGSDLYPVSCVKANGEEYWKIPGSTLRGIFRSWFSRLAARDGKTLSDSVETYLVRGERKSEEMHRETDVVLSLFGSLEHKDRTHFPVEDDNRRVDPVSPEHKGRIHFCDAYSSRPAKREADIQQRTHVVIDRFTGGTNDGKLFQNCVLAPANEMLFETEISIDEAPNDEARKNELSWLSATLQAIHMGILRIGSSKAAGRLEIASAEVLSNPSGFPFNLTYRERN